MINHNALLYSLLDKTITLSYGGSNWVVNYTEGDLFELTKKLNDSNTKYPIIWLQSGYRVERSKTSRKITLQSCQFFFITKGSTTDLYEKRYNDTYKELLYKLLMIFDEVARKSKGVSLSNTDNFTTYPFNDTSQLNWRKDQKLPITDIWDALELETDLEISTGCYPEFLIK